MLTGQTIETYHIGQLLGRSSTAEVYEARQPRVFNRLVAFKHSLVPVHHSNAANLAFLSEALVAAAVPHPNIVPIFDIGQMPDGEPFFTMQRLTGVTLRFYFEQRLRQNAPVTDKIYSLETRLEHLKACLPILWQVAYGLESIHDAGYLHGNFKPEHVFVHPQGHATLFGFRTHNPEMGLVGAPRYLSPEELRGEPLEYRSDLYAFGVVVHEMLFGHVPFESVTPTEMVLRRLTEPFPAFPNQGAALSPHLEQILQTALNRTLSNRYSSATAFVQDLDQALHNNVIPLRVITPVGHSTTEPMPASVIPFPGPSTLPGPPTQPGDPEVE